MAILGPGALSYLNDTDAVPTATPSANLMLRVMHTIQYPAVLFPIETTATTVCCENCPFLPLRRLSLLLRLPLFWRYCTTPPLQSAQKQKWPRSTRSLYLRRASVRYTSLSRRLNSEYFPTVFDKKEAGGSHQSIITTPFFYTILQFLSTCRSLYIVVLDVRLPLSNFPSENIYHLGSCSQAGGKPIFYKPQTCLC